MLEGDSRSAIEFESSSTTVELSQSLVNKTLFKNLEFGANARNVAEDLRSELFKLFKGKEQHENGGTIIQKEMLIYYWRN